MNPVESVVSAEDTTQAPTEGISPTPSFFPTVAGIQNSLEASTTKSETFTFVPFIPNVLPEANSAMTDEIPLVAAAEESTEDEEEDVGDVIAADTRPEATTQQDVETESEVEEIPSAEEDDGGEAEPGEHVTDGKDTSS